MSRGALVEFKTTYDVNTKTQLSYFRLVFLAVDIIKAYYRVTQLYT